MRTTPDRPLVPALLVAFVASLVAVAPLWGQTAPFPTTEGIFRQVVGGIEGSAIAAATGIFKMLFGLEILFTFYGWWRDQGGWDELFAELVKKAAIGAFILGVLMKPDALLYPVVDGISTVGANLGGRSVSTEQLMDEVAIYDDAFWSAVLTPLKAAATNPLDALFRMLDVLEALSALLLGMVFALGSYVGICVVLLILWGQLVVAKVRMMIVLSTAVVFLGFSGFRITAGMGEGYVKYALYCAVQLFFLNMMIGIGYERLFPAWRDAILTAVRANASGANTPVISAIGFDFGLIWSILASMLVFTLLCMKVPGELASRLTGDMRIGIAETIRGKH